MADVGGSRRAAGIGDGALEGLLVFLVAASLLGLVAGWTGTFSPGWIVAAAAVAALVHARGAARAAGDGLAWRHVLPVLLVALALRLPPGDYVLGGQDQGVYQAMASELLRTGDLVVEDGEFARLSATGQAERYLQDNYTNPFIPGVYSQGAAPPALTFQFYHVFPAWLALAQGLLGPASGGWALVFLALCSILFFQRLAVAITGSDRVGMAAGALLALNPLHAMFSRFPVTEVPTLAFSAAGFLFLARYALAEAGARRPRWLLLSVLAFLALFLTRISGFMYLPLVGMVSAAALSWDADRARAGALGRWALGCVLAYGVSVAYGLAFSRPYALDIYRASFSLLAGDRWPQAVGAVVALAGAAWLGLWLATRRGPPARLAALRVHAAPAIGVLVAAILAAGAWKAWRLGFTTDFVGDAWLSRFAGIAGGGIRGSAHASLVVVAGYLSPPLLLCLPWIAWRARTAAGGLLAFFVACFLAYAAFLNWTVVYQPYYARYFCSELVPYALLLCACPVAWWPAGTGRRVLIALLVLAGLWSAWLSARVLGDPANAGARPTIGRLAALAGDRDVILLDVFHGPGWQPKEVKSTLVYVFGRHVVSVGDRGMSDAAYLAALESAYDRVLLVTEGPLAPRGFERLGRIRLEATDFERGPWPPHRRVRALDADLHVYRLAQPPLAVR